MGQLNIFWCFSCLIVSVYAIPAGLLYEYNVREAVRLPKGDDVSSAPIKLKVRIVFYNEPFDTIYVNSNGILSFQTEIPNFFNIEFPLDYPVISPFYTNVDTTLAGTVSYYQTENESLLKRAAENIHDNYLNSGDYKPTNLLIVTWEAVGYHKKKSDKLNTYQVIISTDGSDSFVEFLYPENGIQWIQGTGDESGLPDARAQAGFVSPDGKVFKLTGSGTEQVKNLEKWSNINLNGQWTFKIDGNKIVEPDQNNDEKPNAGPGKTCAETPTYCHIQATCVDHDEGLCCKCKEAYYGNGKYCIKRDAPLRVNGKITGNINGERLGNLDLQSYIVMADARAYTAISKIPTSIGFDIQSLQILGGVIGFLFAKPLRQAVNGYQLTGGVFNHTAYLRFTSTNQTIIVKQKYLGLDVFDQLQLEANIQGEIPTLPTETQVEVDEYQEDYTVTAPGILQMTSTRKFKYLNTDKVEITQDYTVEQTFQFKECQFGNSSLGSAWRLKVGKNFIRYEAREQIIRFGLSNKIMPIGDFDPCEEGRSKCGSNSVCVTDNDSYNCACKPGYQNVQSETGTTCEDVNECQTGTNDCDYNARCINQIGGYQCQCNPGFEGNGQSCVNSASCANVQCIDDSECFENNGVASCRCMQGFTGDGQICKPKVDHSCHVANNCSPYGVCEISSQTNEYKCLCTTGYTGDGYTCIPIETTTEMSTDRITTDRVPQTCDNSTCWCQDEYVLDQDTLFCVRKDTNIQPTPPPKVTCHELNNCHRDAQCIFDAESNTYRCLCNAGFEGNGYECNKERVSCTVENNCDPHAICTYDQRIGKSRCACNHGYEGDGYSCTLAICNSNSDCTTTEECLFTNSRRYECLCKEGYVRDSQNQCIDATGKCGGGTCVENAECLFDESYQTHYCTCKTGYVGDGITECKLKPVGCNVANNCGLHAECIFDLSTGVHQCSCSQGYHGDGFVCQTEKNCLIDPKICDLHASCIPDRQRRYFCQCNQGYIGNGSICKLNPSHEGNFLLLNQGMATLRMPLDDKVKNNGKTIQIKSSQTAVGLDVDCLEGRVYWSDITGRTIRSSTYNGSEKIDLITEDVGSPEGISIDWVSRNMYWTDSTKDTIEVVSLEGRRRRTLFDTGLVNPRGIAVHPQRGKLFWTDWDRRHPKIEWSNADGTGRAIFLEGDSVSLPNSLTIDYDTEDLCYADAGTKKIECVQIDSKVKRTIADNCTYPFGITTTDKMIYWSDWISKQVERVDKSTMKRLPSLSLPLGGTGSKLFGLVAVPQSCLNLSNACQRYKDQCPPEHICLPNGDGSRTCVCSYKANSRLERPTCNL